MSSRDVIVLPGGQYGPHAPLPMYAADADHGMYVPGRLAASAAVLGQVATAVEDFLDEVVWAG